MSFNTLRHILTNTGPRAIRWIRSGIVEVAELESNGAVRVTNIVSRRTYTIPRRHSTLYITVLPPDTMVSLGSLMEKQ